MISVSPNPAITYRWQSGRATDEHPPWCAVLTAQRRELSDAALLGALVSMGAVTFKVTAAIHWEALRLWLKRIRLRPRPAAPAHIATIVRNGNAGLRSS